MLSTLKRPTGFGATAALATLGLLAATALSGCGSDDADANPGATTTALNGDVYNDSDVTFAQQMIPHHAQALAMADMTRGRELSPEVTQLAEAIMEAQIPEIETMTGWLTSWDEEVPETMRDHANAHGDGMADMDDDMPGMMSQDDIDALEAAPDAEFEDMWLQMMKEHHEGAIAMAKTEQEDGEFEPTVKLAADIEDAQTAEVDQIAELLDD